MSIPVVLHQTPSVRPESDILKDILSKDGCMIIQAFGIMVMMRDADP